jgi:hypothetical protein
VRTETEKPFDMTAEIIEGPTPPDAPATMTFLIEGMMMKLKAVGSCQCSRNLTICDYERQINKECIRATIEQQPGRQKTIEFLSSCKNLYIHFWGYYQ